jgi:hypothetical protein
MKDGIPGLVTAKSQPIYLMVGSMSLVPVECPSLSNLLRSWSLTCRCPVPPVFIKESSGSVSRPLGHSLPSDSLVGELYGAIALPAVRSAMVIGFCGQVIYRFAGMDF